MFISCSSVLVNFIFYVYSFVSTIVEAFILKSKFLSNFIKKGHGIIPIASLAQHVQLLLYFFEGFRCKVVVKHLSRFDDVVPTVHVKLTAFNLLLYRWVGHQVAQLVDYVNLLG